MKFNVSLFGFKPKTHCIYQFCFCKDNNEYSISYNKYFKVNWIKKGLVSWQAVITYKI